MKPYLLLLSLFIFSCDNPEEPDTIPPSVAITFSAGGFGELGKCN